MTTDIFSDAEVISEYTDEQATEDGLLLELSVLKDKIKGIDSPNSPFSHVTTNLLKKCGYMTDNFNATCSHGVLMRECPYCHERARDTPLNLPNILDLLNQALQILKRRKRGDWHYEGRIELPSGLKQLIYIEQNGTGRFTIMLPEDR